MSQALTIALRSIVKGRYYSLVSVAGLSIAITVALLVALLVQHETSYDRGFARADSIYRVTWQDTGTGDRFATMFNIFSQQMKIDFEEVEEVARLGVFEQTLQRSDQDPSSGPAAVRYHNIAMVDPTFFSLFDLDFISGGPGSLAQPNRHRSDKLFRAERDALEIELPGLHFGKIENVVNETEKGAARVATDLEQPVLLFTETNVFQHAKNAEYAIERRAYFMAHHGKEARLRFARDLGALLGLDQLRGCRLPFRDVPQISYEYFTVLILVNGDRKLNIELFSGSIESR